MSLRTNNLSAMAFKTRSGRTVAVGTGAMTTAIAVTLCSMLFLLLPSGVAIGFAALLLFPDSRDLLEQPISYALAFAITGLGFLLLLRTIALACGLTAFVGSKYVLRDHLSAIGQSRTGQLAATSAFATLTLMIAMKFPFGESRLYAVILLTIALIWIEVVLVRCLRRIGISNRKRAYYEGMSDDEKKRADRPRVRPLRPSFPDPSKLTSAEDAGRYQRRADDVAELHTWIGAAIIVIFTAFVGASISGFIEGAGPISALSMYVVLGFIGLGFWIQRRARGYRALSEDFANRRQELELELELAEAELALSDDSSLIQRWAAVASRLFVRAE